MAEYSLTPARVPGSWVGSFPTCLRRIFSFSPDLFSRGPAQGLPGVGRGWGSAFAGRLRLDCGSRNDPLGSATARCVTARGSGGLNQLITQRSLVQIQPPQPSMTRG